MIDRVSNIHTSAEYAPICTFLVSKDEERSPDYVRMSRSYVFVDRGQHETARRRSEKMATMEQKVFCVLEFAKLESTTSVQRAYRRKFGIGPPGHASILRWFRQFQATGCLCKGKSPGRPRVPEETVERVRQSFARSPRKSTRRASRELQIPHQTVWKVLRRTLSVKPYRVQLVQQLKVADYPRRAEFCDNMQQELQDDDFARRFIVSDEATFQVSGKVNRHNVHIWGTENPHAIHEHQRDSPKVNVFCAIARETVYGPFFFAENTVTGMTYLDMLQEWLFPQLVEDIPDFVFQQDGAPPHWHLSVRGFLNNTVPYRWIGRAGADDLVLLLWPPRSPDLTACDFFLWGYIKDIVYHPPLATTIDELKERITAAVATIDRDMLARVWNEFDYRLDVCRVTNGAHIEHL